MARRAGWRQSKRDQDDHHGGPIQTPRLVWLSLKVERTGQPQRFLSACQRYGHSHVFEIDTSYEAGILDMAPAEYLAERQQELEEQEAWDWRVGAKGAEGPQSLYRPRVAGQDWT